jgi:hypothetical protein
MIPFYDKECRVLGGIAATELSLAKCCTQKGASIAFVPSWVTISPEQIHGSKMGVTNPAQVYRAWIPGSSPEESTTRAVYETSGPSKLYIQIINAQVGHAVVQYTDCKRSKKRVSGVRRGNKDPGSYRESGQSCPSHRSMIVSDLSLGLSGTLV